MVCFYFKQQIGPAMSQDNNIDFKFSFLCIKSIKEGMFMRFRTAEPAVQIVSIRNDGKGNVIYRASDAPHKDMQESQDYIVELAGEKQSISIPRALQQYALFVEMMNLNGGMILETFSDPKDTPDAKKNVLYPVGGEGMTELVDAYLDLYSKYEDKALECGFGLKLREDSDYETYEDYVLENEDRSYFRSKSGSADANTSSTLLSLSRNVEEKNGTEDKKLTLVYQLANSEPSIGITRRQNVEFSRSELTDLWSASINISDIPKYNDIGTSADHLGQTLISMGNALIKEKANLSLINVNNLKVAVPD